MNKRHEGLFSHIYYILRNFASESSMASQKIDNVLNLALSVDDAERRKSEELNVGYDPVDNTWEIIVKYSGDLQEIMDIYPEIQIVPLITEYAIVNLPQRLIIPLSEFPQIEYIEKPKTLYFGVNQGKSASCVSGVQGRNHSNLSGQGVIVAVIDSGIDYTHPDFINEDGTTRILSLWDQTIPGNPPEGYVIGSEYTSEQINAALQADSIDARRELVPSVDTSGHGTSVAGIAAGNGRASDNSYVGVAPRSDLIIVKMGLPRGNSFPRTTELMRGIDYAVRKSIALNRPVAINLSFGNTYGSHSGDSLLETFINDISNLGRTSIIAGSGNEGSAGGHTSGILTQNQDVIVQLSVGMNQTAFSVQLWKYIDQFAIEITAPNGESSGILRSVGQTYHISLGDTNVYIYCGDPSPYSMSQEAYVDFVPVNTYVDSGIWNFRIIPERVVNGTYDLWLPSSGVLNQTTRFFYPTPDTTLTIPSAARSVITVGAYDSRYQSYADFSGRGYTRVTNDVKPDLVAPGVNIMAPAVGGGYMSVTGTSFAAPFVTGAAALLMEMGIVQGVDPYLYGEKLKAYLIRGARQLSNESEYPNPRTGYGALCLEASLP